MYRRCPSTYSSHLPANSGLKCDQFALVDELSEGLPEQVALEQVGLIQADWEQAVDLEQAHVEQAQWDQQDWLGQADLEQVHQDKLWQDLQEWDLHYHLDQGLQELVLVDLKFLRTFISIKSHLPFCSKSIYLFSLLMSFFAIV